MLGYLQSLSADILPSFDPHSSFICPEGLIRAAEKGCLPLLTALRERGANFNCHTPGDRFPMGAMLIKWSAALGGTTIRVSGRIYRRRIATGLIRGSGVYQPFDKTTAIVVLSACGLLFISSSTTETRSTREDLL